MGPATVGNGGRRRQARWGAKGVGGARAARPGLGGRPSGAVARAGRRIRPNGDRVPAGTTALRLFGLSAIGWSAWGLARSMADVQCHCRPTRSGHDLRGGIVVGTQRGTPAGAPAHGRTPVTDAAGVALATQGLAKRYGPRVALDGLDLRVPDRRRLRVPRAQRRRQDHDDADPHRAHPAGRRQRRAPGPAVRPGRPASACSRSGALIESPSFYPFLSGRENLRALAATGAPTPARAASTSCSSWSTCATGPRTRCRATRWA